MTVAATSNSVKYTGNGVTTTFPYTFRIPTDDDVVVRVVTIATGAYTDLLPAEYTITGVGDDAGGSVEYPLVGSPLASTHELYIIRELDYTQDLDLTNQDGFYPQTFELALDRIVMMVQQLANRITRSLSNAYGSPGLEASTALIANQVVVVNSTANGLATTGPTTTQISNAEANATAAAASASAAAASASAAAASAALVATETKASVVAATTGNITLSGAQTIDGVSVVAGNRVLVKDQSTPSQNGIYVAAAGAWSRSGDMDTWAEIVSAVVWVQQGTINGDTAWVFTNNTGGTLGSTSVVVMKWAQANNILLSKNVDYTVTDGDNGAVILVDASGANRTITLPAATGRSGFKIIVKKADSSTNTVIIDGNASETLDGATTKVLRIQYQTVALVCDGTGWQIMGEGSIFEIGSNGNGEYIKFANGRMICTFTSSSSTRAITTATGSNFRTAAVQARTWAVAFTALHSAGVSIVSTSTGVPWMTMNAASLTGCSYYYMSSASVSLDIVEHTWAIGTWF